MRTPLLLAATAVLAVGSLAGCARTIPGTVAMTTELGPDADASSPSSPSLPPGSALSVTCAQYLQLDVGTQTELIQEILQNGTSTLSPGDAAVAKTLADAVCTFLPQSSVADILLGETPP
ncbi:hypothetical protein MMAD_51460 [Mycolicibacterium madagascariense]|uniref:DUF732 domain-containing protein n=1 Tax=Mycolicibacterium madagascariense TaxID=212765 RepID=A0A7I7XNN1_9MYCO|nr:hypothetical protein [Mycolicibacterium madagascariense]MCV7012072.1 hypothetical protein [Mycolicibacterium madagascariense]BBZ30851.1 hypothetical protein MMAD_51460 [Mycolicibacterium madagascariense]